MSQAIVEKKGHFPIPRVLLAKDDAPRVIVNGNRHWLQNSDKVALVRELLAVGSCTTDTESSAGVKALLRQGFVAPQRPMKKGEKSIVRFLDHDTTVCVWAHNMQVLFARMNKIDPLPTVAIPEAEISSPFDLLLDTVPMFKMDSLVAHIEGKSQQPLEYHFQKTFTQAVREEVTLLNEVTLSKGRVDFIVTLDNGVAFAIELLMNGKTIRDHMSRFKRSAKYGAMGANDWMVIDCCTHPVEDDAKDDAHYARLSPHHTVGWNVIVIEHRGKTLYVPRDSVRRYCPNIEARAPLLKPSVKLYVAPSSVWVKKEAGRPFRVTPQGNDIESLKNAIADYREKYYTIVPPDAITIYDPDGNEVDVEELNCNTFKTPYLFNLP